MEKKYNKYIFKKNPILLFDFLKAKKRPNKSLKFFLRQKNDNIQREYNVNKLASMLHPLRQNVKVKNIVDHKNGCVSYVLEGDGCNLAFFRAGQYITINLDINGVNISRPYSISSSPKDALTKNIYQITIKYLNSGFFSKYLINNLKVGDKCWVSGPEGEFYHDDIRDKKNVLAIAGGVGITPFISIAKDIVENDLDINFTLIYSAQTKKDLTFYDELKQLDQKSKNIRVIFLTTREKNDDCINSRFDDKLFKKYYNDASIVICGSKPLCDSVIDIAKKHNVEDKLIRYETNEPIKLDEEKEYKNISNKKEYKIKVHLFDNVYEINAKREDSILVSLQKAKLHTQSKCLNGKCSWCRIRLIKGNVYTPKKIDGRRKADIDKNIYHSCCTFPISDIEIETY